MQEVAGRPLVQPPVMQRVWQVGETVGSLTVERLLGRGAYGEAEQLNHKLSLVSNVSGPGYTTLKLYCRWTNI